MRKHILAVVLFVFAVLFAPAAWNSAAYGAAPAFTSTNNATFAQGTAGSFTLSASGGGTMTFTLPTVGTAYHGTPTGVSISGSSLVSTAATPAGTYPFTITAANGTAPNATQVFTLTVQGPPVFLSTASAAFTLGRAGSYTVTAIGPPAPTFAITSSGTPTGVAITSAGVLSTTAATPVGTYALTIQATNSVASVNQTFTLTINPALTLSTTPPSGTVNQAYSSTTITTSGGTGATTFSLSSGTLPPGLSLNTTAAVPTTYVASGGTNALNTANDMAFDTGGNLYVANYANGNILKVPPGGGAANVSVFASGFATSTLRGMAVDSSGNLYTGSNATLYKVTPAGTWTSFYTAASPWPTTIYGLGIDSANNVYVPGYSTSNSIFTVSPSGVKSTLSLSGAALNEPIAVAFANPGNNPAGNIYVANYGGGTVSQVTSTGVTTTFALTPTFSFNPAKNLTIDNWGNLYVANESGNTVSKVTPTSATTATVTSSFISSGLSSPIGLAFDSLGSLYILNDGNNTIMKAGPSTTVLSGTPTTAGTYSFTITATDWLGATSSQSYSITIAPAPLVITTTSLPNWTVGQQYIQTILGMGPGGTATYAIAASGGTAPCTFTVTAGSPPAGLTLSSAGVLSGTPSAAGTFTFTVTATDSTTPTALTTTQNYTVTINSPPTITPTSLPGSTANLPGYSQTISASGGTGAIMLSVSSGTLPPGLSLNTSPVVPTTYVATGGTNALNTANDMAFDKAGNLYVANYANGNILKVPPGGGAANVSVFASGFTTSTLRGIALDTLGNLYTGSNGTLYQVAPSGTYTTFKTGFGPTTIYGLATDASNNVYVPSYTLTSTANAGTIYKVSSTGTVTQLTPTASTGTGLTEPIAMVFDAQGNMYVANYTGNSISKVTPSLVSTQLASLTFGPKNLTIDAWGNLYVANEVAAGAVYKVTQAGVVTTFVSSGLNNPIGLAFDSSGNLYILNDGSNTIMKATPSNSVTLSGTPTAAGTYPFTITATDWLGATSSQSYSITISPSVGITTTSLPNWTVGQSYSQTISASGGTSPYTFAVTSGIPPTNLNLSSAGVLSGTPSATGTYNFTVTATDANSSTATQSYTVIINSTATITPTSGLPGSTVNVAGYSQTISASGGTGAITLSLSAGTLPPGLSLSTPSSTFVNGGGLNDANDIAFDTAGNLYVANYGAGNILKVTPGGVVSTFASGFTTSTVRGMVIDAAGNLYVGSLASLIKVSPTGTWSTLATPGPSTIYGLALDTAGNIYVPGYTSNTTTIFKVTPTGAVSTFITNSLLNEPVAMIFDTAGNAYVTNYASGTTGAGTVVKVTPTGTVTTLASGFSTPKGLTIDAAGNLYIANETGSSAVSRVTPTGAVSTFVSGSGLSAPIGVAFDSSGNLYVLNNSTNTITKVTPNVVLLSGTPTAAGTFNFTITAADGTGSTSGQPYSITMSPAPLAIATAGLPNSTVSQPYSQTIVATAGAAPYTFAVTAGSPPASLTLSSAGVLSGTSSTTGTFTFTVTAADSTTPTPMTASQAYTVSINPAATITPASLPSSIVNVAGYSQSIAASGGTGAIALSLSSGSLPPGLSLSTPAVVTSTFVNGGGLSGANDIAFDTGGNLYVANYSAGNILKVTPGGASSIFASGFATSTVRGMAIDAVGNLYVGSLSSLIKVSPTGTWSTFATPGPSTIYGLAIDNAGNIYVPSYTTANTILRVTPAGAVSTFVNTNSLLNQPVAMVFDTAGNSYVTNYASGTSGAGTLVKVTPSGTVTLLASGFSAPKGLTIDTAGNLYVANETLNTVSKVTSAGVVSTLVSSGLSSPIGLAFDTSGNLYILNDSGNTIIKASTPANVTLSGTPTAAGTFNFTMTATDWAGATINKAYSVVISAGVSTIAPLVGPTTGGTTVAITGVGFSGATGVSFGNTALTLAAGPSPTIPGTYWVNSDSSISAVTPAAPAGPVNVVVTAGGAGSTLTLADQFTFELYFNYSWTTWSSLNWSTTAGSTVTWNSQTLPAAFSVSNGFYSWYAPSNTQTVNPLTGAISSTSPTSPYIWPGYSNSVPPQPITGSSLVTNIAGSAGMDGPFTNDPAGNNGSILSGDWKDFATGQLSYYGPYSNTTAWQNPVFWSYYNILVTGGQLPSNYTVTATTTTVTHSSGYQYFLTSDNTPNSPLGRTSYAGNSGMYYFNTDPSNTANAKYSNGPFFQDSRTKVTDISDGSSNTLLFGESLGGPDNALPTYQLSWMGSGTMPSYWDCQTPSQYFMFSSMHPGVVNFAFCDGSVRSITKVTASVPLDSMGALTGAPVTGDGTNTDSETAKPPAASNPPTARWIAFQLLAGISDNVSPDVTQLGLTP